MEVDEEAIRELVAGHGSSLGVPARGTERSPQGGRSRESGTDVPELIPVPTAGREEGNTGSGVSPESGDGEGALRRTGKEGGGPLASERAGEGDSRRRRVALPDFGEAFMHDSRIPRRHVVYINGALKRKITDVVRELGGGEVSLAGYVENIIEHHLEMYRDEINRRHQAARRDEIL